MTCGGGWSLPWSQARREHRTVRTDADAPPSSSSPAPSLSTASQLTPAPPRLPSPHHSSIDAPAMSSSPPPPPMDDDGAEEEEGGGRNGEDSYAKAEYWDARYVKESGAQLDWYQRYDTLRPFVRLFAPLASRILMIGCGSALMSEDMVNDGYVEIVNIDISSVVIEMMRKKYFDVPQLQYLRMDVRDMGMFSDESFDCAIDKGTLDSLLCGGVDAPLSAVQMVLEVDRLLRPGGVFILITYGDPSVRVPHLNQSGCKWKIVLYILPRHDFQGKITRSILDPIALTERGRLPDGFVLEDPDSLYVYVCKKTQELTGSSSPTIEQKGE